MILFKEATQLLELAKDGEGVEAERARAFATAVIDATELGRIAIAVLDGGLFADARLVELAKRVVVADGDQRKAIVSDS